MGRKYVLDGAILQCSAGLKPAKLMVITNQKVKIQGKFKATDTDLLVPETFFQCKLKPTPSGAFLPCIPMLQKWQKTSKKTNLRGIQKFLFDDSYTMCGLGRVTIINPMQINAAGAAFEQYTNISTTIPGAMPLAGFDEGTLPEEDDSNGFLDGFQTVLDIAGLVPGFGEIADGINAAIYVARGDYANAALSAAAMIPIGGQAATAAKLGIKGADVAKTAAKNADEVADFANASYKNLKNTKPCFLAGTPIQTVDKLTPIEELKIGDKVKSYDFNTGKTVIGTVSQLFQNWTENVYEIHTEEDLIKTTGRHLFWIENENKWVAAKDLRPQMSLKSFNGTFFDIQKIVKQPETHDTYNFEVDDYHNYFVSSLGLLVHNSSKPSLFESTDKKSTAIYEVYDPATDNVEYVGQTTKDSVEDRFDEHKAEGTKKNNHKSNWDDYEIREVDRGDWTPYEAHVNEQHHIEKNGGKGNLQNKKNAITEKKFDKYKDPKYGHNPC